VKVYSEDVEVGRKNVAMKVGWSVVTSRFNWKVGLG